MEITTGKIFTPTLSLHTGIVFEELRIPTHLDTGLEPFNKDKLILLLPRFTTRFWDSVLYAGQPSQKRYPCYRN
jgi:hypothetical protein